MKRLRFFFLLLLLSITSVLAQGCGGKIASTGSAFVTDVSPHGVFRMQYDDGKVEWKRVNPDNPVEQTRIAYKNRSCPARYVETKRGSTLTFVDGKTINYYPIH
ncbi:MAG: hypothetical protein AB7V04_06595 [Desulfomonilaceae bacterium]